MSTYSYILSKDIIARAQRLFWLNYIGRRGIAEWLILSAFMLGLLWLPHAQWLPMVAGISIVILPLLWVCGYFTYVSRANRRYDRMESKLISFHFTEEGIGSVSDLGKSEISWRSLDSVVCGKNIWLLQIVGGAYLYIPVTDESAAVRELILARAQKDKRVIKMGF